MRDYQRQLIVWEQRRRFRRLMVFAAFAVLVGAALWIFASMAGAI